MWVGGWVGVCVCVWGGGVGEIVVSKSEDNMSVITIFFNLDGSEFQKGFVLIASTGKQ